MNVAKRIGFFIGLNLLVILSISLLLSLFNVQPYLTQRGLNISQLLFFCGIWGFGGAFISLAISRMSAKWMMGVKLIDPKNVQNEEEKWILNTTYEYSRRAGLKVMPEVGVYASPDPNAFATGPTRNRALVAVSSGLVENLDRDAVEGVIAHEVAHIANGDMVTMTLLQGVLNAFVMFIARLLSYAISLNVKEESRPLVSMLVTIVLEIGLSFLALFAIAYVSRYREFRADFGGAQLAGREKMLRGLRELQQFVNRNTETQTAPSLATLQISGKPNRFLALLSTHPPIEERIAALKIAQLQGTKSRYSIA